MIGKKVRKRMTYRELIDKDDLIMLTDYFSKQKGEDND